MASRAKHVVLDLMNPDVHAHRQCEAPEKYEFCPAVNSRHRCGAADRYGFCPALHAHYQIEADNFGKLKRLELHFVSDLGNHGLFLANCPSLEWLSITHSSVPGSNIPHQLHRLQYLLVSDCCVQSIGLHAMGLTAFEYVGLPVPIKFDDSFKLSKANITLRWSSGNVHYIVNDLCRSLAHVDNLFIKFSGLDTKITGLTDNLSKFIHLRHLVLDFTIRRDLETPFDVLQLTYILEASPRLEYFVLNMHTRILEERTVMSSQF